MYPTRLDEHWFYEYGDIARKSGATWIGAHDAANMLAIAQFPHCKQAEMRQCVAAYSIAYYSGR